MLRTEREDWSDIVASSEKMASGNLHGTSMAPRRFKNGPKMDPRDPKRAHKTAKLPPRGPKRAPG